MLYNIVCGGGGGVIQQIMDLYPFLGKLWHLILYLAE